MQTLLNEILTFSYHIEPVFSILQTVFAGQKYYYNSKTNVSQWVHPSKPQQVATQHHDTAVSSNATIVTWGNQASTFQRCIECGGWGVGLVQSWGYCKHCTRYAVNVYIFLFWHFYVYLSLFSYNSTTYKYFSSMILMELALLSQLLGLSCFCTPICLLFMYCTAYIQYLLQAIELEGFFEFTVFGFVK